MSRLQHHRTSVSRRVSRAGLQRGKAELHAKAAELKKKRIDVVDMSGYVIERPYGEFISPPEYVLDAVRRALKTGWPEPSPRGIAELRMTIAEAEERALHIDIEPENEVIVTSGGTMQGLYNAIQATIDPGDEVLIFRPGLGYDEIVRLAEGVPVFVDLDEEDGYRFDPQDLDAATTERTKMVILNTPHNPSGHVASRSEIEGVAAYARRHNLLVISDEILSNWVYGGSRHISIASMPGMKDRTIVLNGLTKSGMFDWRVGWAIAPANIIDRLEKLMFWQNQFSAPLLQVATQAHLSRLREWIAPVIQKQQKKRDSLHAELVRIGLPCFKPEGAIMAFPNITKYEKDSVRFSERLLTEGHVLVSPGAAYLGEGHLRIGYGDYPDRIKEGMSRIARVLSRSV